MLYKITNISNGLIVCDLKDKSKSLRLNCGGVDLVEENNITPHIDKLVSDGLVLKEVVVNKKTKKKLKEE